MDMKIFRDSSTLIKSTLQKAQGDFKFDKLNIKKTLLRNIEEHQLTSAMDIVNKIKSRSFIKRHQISSIIIGAFFVTTSSAIALTHTNLSNPGGKLHILDQMEEQVLLNLPLPENQRVNLQARILEERSKELDYIIQAQDENNVKMEAIKESQDFLNSAVDRARTAKEDSAHSGKPSQEAKYNKALNRLELIAEEQEKQVLNLKQLEKNSDTKKELDIYLDAIKQARERAKVQVK